MTGKYDETMLRAVGHIMSTHLLKKRKQYRIYLGGTIWSFQPPTRYE